MEQGRRVSSLCGMDPPSSPDLVELPVWNQHPVHEEYTIDCCSLRILQKTWGRKKVVIQAKLSPVAAAGTQNMPSSGNTNRYNEKIFFRASFRDVYLGEHHTRKTSSQDQPSD
ncbi:unnamed protein product [Caretta caretta]